MDTFKAERPVETADLIAAAERFNYREVAESLLAPINECLDEVTDAVMAAGVVPDGERYPSITVHVEWSQ